MCYKETRQHWHGFEENPCIHPTEMTFDYIGTTQYCCTNFFDGKKGKRRYYNKKQMEDYYKRGGKTTQAPLPRTRCGRNFGDANSKCGKTCSDARDCDSGEFCYNNLASAPCTGEVGVGFELMNAQQATEFNATDILVYGFAVIGLVAIVGGAHRLLKKKNDPTVEFSEL